MAATVVQIIFLSKIASVSVLDTNHVASLAHQNTEMNFTMKLQSIKRLLQIVITNHDVNKTEKLSDLKCFYTYFLLAD